MMHDIAQVLWPLVLLAAVAAAFFELRAKRRAEQADVLDKRFGYWDTQLRLERDHFQRLHEDVASAITRLQDKQDTLDSVAIKAELAELSRQVQILSDER